MSINNGGIIVVHQLLAQMENGYMKIIKENLVGIYLHGSYAFGTYCHSVSDLDVLIVVYEKLTIDEKKQLLDYTINILDKWAPKKGIEFHV
ncbi:nucleotidyltransferase domain-containing protein, partial [Enterococcus faecalis]|nr:nucleotidyltransferase domain-containing protein [Enterococcus faecalis]